MLGSLLLGLSCHGQNVAGLQGRAQDPAGSLPDKAAFMSAVSRAADDAQLQQVLTRFGFTQEHASEALAMLKRPPAAAAVQFDRVNFLEDFRSAISKQDVFPQMDLLLSKYGFTVENVTQAFSLLQTLTRDDADIQNKLRMITGKPEAPEVPAALIQVSSLQQPMRMMLPRLFMPKVTLRPTITRELSEDQTQPDPPLPQAPISREKRAVMAKLMKKYMKGMKPQNPEAHASRPHREVLRPEPNAEPAPGPRTERGHAASESAWTSKGKRQGSPPPMAHVLRDTLRGILGPGQQGIEKLPGPAAPARPQRVPREPGANPLEDLLTKLLKPLGLGGKPGQKQSPASKVSKRKTLTPTGSNMRQMKANRCKKLASSTRKRAPQRKLLRPSGSNKRQAKAMPCKKRASSRQKNAAASKALAHARRTLKPGGRILKPLGSNQLRRTKSKPCRRRSSSVRPGASSSLFRPAAKILRHLGRMSKPLASHCPCRRLSRPLVPRRRCASRSLQNRAARGGLGALVPGTRNSHPILDGFKQLHRAVTRLKVAKCKAEKRKLHATVPCQSAPHTYVPRPHFVSELHNMMDAAHRLAAKVRTLPLCERAAAAARVHALRARLQDAMPGHPADFSGLQALMRRARALKHSARFLPGPQRRLGNLRVESISRRLRHAIRCRRDARLHRDSTHALLHHLAAQRQSWYA